MRAAIVQAESAASLRQGLEATAELTASAVAQGARLVVFPETWLPGYPAWLDVSRDIALWDHGPTKKVYARYADEAVLVDGEDGKALRAIARANSVTLVVGICERVVAGPGRGTLYNALLIIGPDGTLLNHHRKLMPTHTERMVWGLGDAGGLRAVDSPAGRVGGLICWEHWMPLARQALHDEGEDIHAALWPTVHERHHIASRHYALEGRCYVLAAGSLQRARSLPVELEVDATRVSDPDQWILRGGSAIIAPDGDYVAQAGFDQAAILIADLDLSRVRQESLTLDVSGHYSRPDVFHFAVHRATPSRDGSDIPPPP
jgi:predicted amidohydrolase